MTEGSAENVADELSAAHAHASGLLWSEEAVSGALRRITSISVRAAARDGGSFVDPAAVAGISRRSSRRGPS
ncbi:hypothetical protein [Nocardia sp. XZ_19_369]|uniref:hypothetical protein n=1 Tax=Nocardia sp. XZ_19_369 TaxID=2769487 RepID=UPI00188FA18A|nr:hypothetical protein [Nocardia sp. XZ_19_369]